MQLSQVAVGLLAELLAPVLAHLSPSTGFPKARDAG